MSNIYRQPKLVQEAFSKTSFNKETKLVEETFSKTFFNKETYNINEQSVRVDFDSTDKSDEDEHLGGITSKDQFFAKFKGNFHFCI